MTSKKPSNGVIVVPRGGSKGTMSSAAKPGKPEPSSTPAKQTVGFQVATASSSQPPEINDRLLFGTSAAAGKQVESKVVDTAAKEAEKHNATGSTHASSGFGTDTDISRARRDDREKLFGRELQRWAPEEDDALMKGLSLDDGLRGRPWDQFEANRKQFGVRTSFNEDIYTTKLDKAKAKISEKDAARIAAEIEGKKAANAHQAEERGQIAYREAVLRREKLEVELRIRAQAFEKLERQAHTRPDEDEEARYSAVDRGTGIALADRAHADSRNADTFGAASAPVTARENGSAWSNAAGSVAAISGRPSPVRSSAPIDVDPRREHNKVRMQLTGKQATTASRDRSPYGTPKSLRSPLSSPLVGNASQVEALDLNPGSAKYDPGVRSEFARFKKSHKQDATSPSTESELTKAASAAASAVLSGSAASTPEDRLLADAPSADAATPLAQPVQQSGPSPRSASGHPAPSPGQQQRPYGALQQRHAGGSYGQPSPMHGPPAPHPGMQPGGYRPSPGMQPGMPPYATGPMQARVPVMTIPAKVRPGSGPGMRQNVPGGPSPHARPAQFGSAIPGINPAFGAAPNQMHSNAPRGSLPASLSSSRASQAGSTVGTPTSSRPSTASTIKLNPNAKEFKFNPGAASFVPSSPGLSRAASNASSAAPSMSTSTSASAGLPAQPRPSTVRPLPRPPGPGMRPVSSMPLERRSSRELPPGGPRPQPRSPNQGPRPDRQIQSARPATMQPFPRPGGSSREQQQPQHPMQMGGGSQAMGPPMSPPQMSSPGPGMQPHPMVAAAAHHQQMAASHQFPMGHPQQHFMAAGPQGYPMQIMQPGSAQMAYMGGRPFSPGQMQGQHPQMVSYMAMSPPGAGQPGMYPQQGYAPVGVYSAAPQMGMPMNLQHMGGPTPPGGDRPTSSGRPG